VTLATTEDEQQRAVYALNNIAMKHNVTYRPIARQRFGKHIPAEEYSRNSRTSIAKQWISKEAFSTIERLCFLRDSCRGVIKGQRRSFERVVVEN
jgi:hypothetical protein